MKKSLFLNGLFMETCLETFKVLDEKRKVFLTVGKDVVSYIEKIDRVYKEKPIKRR